MAEAPSHQFPTAPLALPAQPEKTGGRAIGVLLVHGFTGSPASMKPWAQALADQGYAVEVPLLPGHGTRWQDLNRVEVDRLVRRGRGRVRPAARHLRGRGRRRALDGRLRGAPAGRGAR